MPTTTWHNLSEDKRERILLAAAAEFGARGFSAGSLNVVARDAGVAKGSLFQYFADKFELFRHVASEMSRRTRDHMQDRLDAHLARSDDVFAVLRSMLVDWIVFHRDNDLARQMLLATAFEPDPQVRAAVRTDRDVQFAAILEDVIERAAAQGRLRPGTSTRHLAAWVHTLFTHLGMAAISPGMDHFVPLHALGDDELATAVDGFVEPLEGWYGRQSVDAGPVRSTTS